MISNKLKYLILSELGLDDYSIDETTTASMVPGWDSLSHVRILAAIEDAYDIRFKTLDILRLKNVGELEKLINSKISG